VDYFFLLAKANRDSLRAVSAADNVAGWCVGDAHPENFGVLIKNEGHSVFTMNDPDDSGPCPVVLDLYRLMVSSRLYKERTKLNKLLEAYIAGLQGESYDIPAPVEEMFKKSRKKGITPNPDKVEGNKFIRKENITEVSADELAQLKAVVASFGASLAPEAKIIDAVSTRKIGGGSGGLLRYEVLVDNGGTLLHLEFKEETVPSIYPAAAGTIPGTRERISATLSLTQGSGASPYYAVVKVSGKDMLIRPRFAGNVGVSLDKQSGPDNKDIIRYEAYVLGGIHSRSLHRTKEWKKLLLGIPGSAWENDVELMAQRFDLKFTELNR
jgi:hypothetical protein